MNLSGSPRLIFFFASWVISLWACRPEDSISIRHAPAVECARGDRDPECCDRYHFKGGDTAVVNACLFSGYTLDVMQVSQDTVACGAFGEIPGRIPGATPLHFAAGWNSDVDVVTALIEWGIDVDGPDSVGATPLHYAACLNRSPAMVRMLIDSGAEEDSRDTAGANPVYYAVKGGNDLPVIITLIKEGSNPRFEDREGVSAFALARANQDVWNALEEALTPWEHFVIIVEAVEFWLIGVVLGIGGTAAFAFRRLKRRKEGRDRNAEDESMDRKPT